MMRLSTPLMWASLNKVFLSCHFGFFSKRVIFIDIDRVFSLDKSFKFDCMRMITSDSTQNEALAIYIPIMVLLPGKGGTYYLIHFVAFCILQSYHMLLNIFNKKSEGSR